MSLIITGTNLLIALFLLIIINGIFTIKRIPILAIPICGISVIFLLAFPIEYDGLSILLTLILIVFAFANLVSNLSEYRGKR